MAGRFSRFIGNVNRGIKAIPNSIRTGFSRAFGGEQPQPQAPPPPQQVTPPLQRPVAPPAPIAPPPTPADYAETYQPSFYDDDYISEQPSVYTPPEEYGREQQVTIYGDGEHFNEPFTLSVHEWMGEVMYDNEELIELYGLDRQDIMQELIDAGQDYPGSRLNSRTGEPISGLWEDYRDQLYGDGDSP